MLPTRHARRTSHAAAIVVFVLALCLAWASVPYKVSAIVVGTPATTLTDNTAGVASTYTFAGYTTDKNRPLSWADVTFPAGTDVSGATAVLAGTTVAVTGPTTVRVSYAPRILGSMAFTVAVGTIVNPAAGTYPANSVTIVCRTTNNGGGQARDEAAATAGYTIVPSPYISLTITTPDTGQTVDFGAIDPGTLTAGQTVTVQVNSSAPYDISRTTGGDAGLLGLLISGNAVGPKPQGLATFTDTYELNPPWTTDPSIPLTATVMYTAVQ